MHRSFGIVLLILFASLPAAAVEVAIAPVTEEAATLSQRMSDGATDGNDFLFVWSDIYEGSHASRAARVTREGAVLDRGGIPIPAHKRNSVVWNGTSYLVLWNRVDAHDQELFEIHGVRIDRDGTIVGGPGVIKKEAAMSAVISNGTDVVIEYRTPPAANGTSEQRVLFLDAQGRVAADRLLAKETRPEIASLAWNGAYFAAVWINSPSAPQADYTLDVIRFDVQGPLDAAPLHLLSSSSAFSDDFTDALEIASDGDDFLLVTNDSQGRAYAQRLSADLRIMGPPSILPWLSYGQEDYYKPNYSGSIFWDGESYLRFAYYLGAISVVRLDRDGRTIRTETVANSARGGSVDAPVAAVNGRDFFLGWTEFSPVPYSGDGSDVFGELLSVSTFRGRARTLLSIAPTLQKRPLVASGGTNLLAVWEEGSAVYARRLGVDGALIDAFPLRLAEQGTLRALVFNGSDYLAVWETPAHEHKIARIPRDGALRTDAGGTLPVANIYGIASDGVTTLLLSGTTQFQVTRIAGDGSVAGTLSLPFGAAGKVDIAAGNGEFLIVWHAVTANVYTSPVTFESRIYGARVSSSLVLLDTPFDLSTYLSQYPEPAAAWNGREWLVVWRVATELRGRRVSRDGVPQGDDRGTSITNHARLASVTWDGKRYVLAWWGFESPALAHTAFLTDLGFSPDGESTIPFQPYDLAPLRFVPVRPGLVATAYARVVPEAGFRDATHVFVNLLTVPPAPAPGPRRRATRST